MQTCGSDVPIYDTRCAQAQCIIEMDRISFRRPDGTLADAPLSRVFQRQPEFRGSTRRIWAASGGGEHAICGAPDTVLPYIGARMNGKRYDRCTIHRLLISRSTAFRTMR